MFFGVWGPRCSRVVPRTPPGTLQAPILSKIVPTKVPKTIFLETDRDRERQRQTDTDTDGDRQRQTTTDRDRQRQRQTET